MTNCKLKELQGLAELVEQVDYVRLKKQKQTDLITEFFSKEERMGKYYDLKSIMFGGKYSIYEDWEIGKFKTKTDAYFYSLAYFPMNVKIDGFLSDIVNYLQQQTVESIVDCFCARSKVLLKGE